MTTERPLKVLTEGLAVRLHDFNHAARQLQGLGVRLLQILPNENRLQVSPEDARWLLSNRRLDGFTRSRSAGSTRYTAQFEGVTLAWIEPISYRDFIRNTLH
ncbi:hypothetical protein [Ectopseudomonas oleovorans]|uniref:Uncharacterized protein n=1 Tax=Ectopseudomonas oleovorans (strain CECT 5344) TaxID=1182590 RepID=W6R7P9_ECTO5|nr:hypothetical protein [Pseudomonas oleovorans]CDM42416.1 hypothetical protein BN5_3874 [Pseudomonas oleovorans CECT 5344]CDR93039.1 hypothetical protein PPSAL_3815 [Pseudomonas oleovorans]